MMLYDLIKSFTGPVLRTAVRLSVENSENVPTDGPVLFASNHLSIVDSTFLPLSISRPITFMAKAEYFTGRNPLHRVTAWFMSSSGQVSVDRNNQRAAVASLEPCLRVLQNGGAFCIYPEGTRSLDGRLYRGRTGAAWLALSSGAPVVPVAMFGTDRVLPPGKTVPRPAKVRVVFGKPVDLSACGTNPGDARARRAVTERIMAAIAEISGQEYVPRYASATRDGA
jgi:1-acyl-sn-glycerol-3-phosphate acyltransferase